MTLYLIAVRQKLIGYTNNAKTVNDAPVFDEINMMEAIVKLGQALPMFQLTESLYHV
jgi:hypothetical protein